MTNKREHELWLWLMKAIDDVENDASGDGHDDYLSGYQAGWSEALQATRRKIIELRSSV